MLWRFNPLGIFPEKHSPIGPAVVKLIDGMSKYFYSITRKDGLIARSRYKFRNVGKFLTCVEFCSTFAAKFVTAISYWGSQNSA